MKTLIAYYTFGGESRKEAMRIAAETEGAVLCEFKEQKNRSVIGSIFACAKAMRHKPSKIKPVGENFADYDRIIIGAPIWADYPAPAWNAIVDLLPPGKEVELYFCSASGGSGKSKQSNIDMVEKKGCKVVSYRDVFTGKGIVKEKRQD